MCDSYTRRQRHQPIVHHKSENSDWPNAQKLNCVRLTTQWQKLCKRTNFFFGRTKQGIKTKHNGSPGLPNKIITSVSKYDLNAWTLHHPRDMSVHFQCLASSSSSMSMWLHSPSPRNCNQTSNIHISLIFNAQKYAHHSFLFSRTYRNMLVFCVCMFPTSSVP